MEVKEKDCEELGSPMKKKQKNSLENRLSDILCCVVCLDLPSSSVMQCPNGHLMCSSCHAHVLADAMLKDSTAACPSCRIDLARHLCSRNLAVEKAVAELLTHCLACNQELPRYELIEHQRRHCCERTCYCKCQLIGCEWQGSWNNLKQHEDNCEFLTKSSGDILQCLQAREAVQPYELEQAKLLELLSVENASFADVHFKACYTEDYTPSLYYESSRFNVCSNAWAVKLLIKENREISYRTLCYQLVCKQRLSNNLLVKFALIAGPYHNIDINIKVNVFEFKDSELETLEYRLPLVHISDCNRLISSKAINLRLIIGTKDGKKS